MNVIHRQYLPFTREHLRENFTSDADANIDYFEASARRYEAFLAENPKTAGIPLTSSKRARQIEKDEKFWTACSLKSVFDSPNRLGVFQKLLAALFGTTPPLAGLSSWEECLKGDLRLFFEAQLPSPSEYVAWIRENLTQHQMIPYVLDSAKRESRRPLEGPTHVDAILVNSDNGFGVLIEAKVLSDVSGSVSFDHFRNQLARNIDVMLERQPNLPAPLSGRDPARSLFALLTPNTFREHPSTRHYGWLLPEYQRSPDALKRDLPHRQGVDWPAVSNRLGWLSFEDMEAELPGSCPWLP